MRAVKIPLYKNALQDGVMSLVLLGLLYARAGPPTGLLYYPSDGLPVEDRQLEP